MATNSRRLARWLTAIGCALLTGVHPQSPNEVVAAPTGQQPPAQSGGGERGGRGGGGLPPMNPIDENAPPPPLVTPGAVFGEAPSDAVVLFNGTDTSQWTLRDGSPARCKVENREMVCRTGDQSIVSKPKYAQRAAAHRIQPSRDGGREGRRQADRRSTRRTAACSCTAATKSRCWIRTTISNKTYPDGSNASLYRVAAPLVNVSRRPASGRATTSSSTPPNARTAS